MLKESVILTAPAGFHARPASQFVKMATESQSEVTLSCGGNDVNGKSIMGILTLGASSGSEVIITVDGPDEAHILEMLIDFLKKMD